MSLEEVVPAPVESVAPSAPAPVASTPTTPTDMGETIRTRLREMSEPAAPAAAAPIRAPDGKFVKAPTLVADVPDPAEAEPVPAEEPPVEEPVPAEEPPVEEPAAIEAVKPGEVDISKPPSSLTAAEKADYEKATPTIKAAFHRREADFHKGLAASREMATIGQMMDAEIRPYEAMLRAANLTPQLAVKDLLNTAYQLRSGTPEQKTQLVINIAKQYGVDLTNVQAIAEEIKANTPVVDPKIVELENRLNTVNKVIEEQKTQAEQAAQAAHAAEVEAFKAKPENKHFEAVRLDMSALLANGRASDLQDAYNKAIWANPVVREQLLAQQREDARKRAAEKAAAAKKAASVNVAPRGTPPAAPVVGTMEDTIRAALKKMSA